MRWEIGNEFRNKFEDALVSDRRPDPKIKAQALIVRIFENLD